MHVSLRRWFSYSYLALALGLTLFTITLCYTIQWHGPFRDLWEFIALIQQELDGHWDLATLVEPYGGIHRIFLPRLLFYLDYRFASGSNMLAMTATLLLHVSACALLLRSVWKYTTQDNCDKAWLIATVLLFFFSTTQIYNLIYISDNQVVIGNSLSVFTGWLFCTYLTNKKPVTLIVANLLALLACLSHGSSLMIWPAMGVMMLISHAPKRDFLLQIALVCVALLLYVSGHDPLDHSTVTTPLWQKSLASMYNIVTHLDGVLRYISLHLSSPTSRDYPVFGALLTAASIAYLLHVSYRAYRQQSQLNYSESFWLTLAWYGFFIAIITAFGRQIYPNSALTDRYQTLVMTYWAAWSLLLYADLKRHQPAWTLVIPALTLLLLLPYQYKNAEDMAWLSSRVTIAHTSATTGITDMNTVAATLSHPLLMDKKNLVAIHNDFFRRERLAYFSDDIARWFDTPDRLFDASIDSTVQCSGKLTSAEILTPEDGSEKIRLAGSAWNETTHQALNELLIVDSKNRVIGLARAHREKGEFLPLSWRDAKHSHWIGFIHSAKPLDFPLEFLGKTSDSFCRVLTISSIAPTI